MKFITNPKYRDSIRVDIAVKQVINSCRGEFYSVYPLFHEARDYDFAKSAISYISLLDESDKGIFEQQFFAETGISLDITSLKSIAEKYQETISLMH